MKKRLLATIPVLLVVFLCSSFNVFADTVAVKQIGNSHTTYLNDKIVIDTNTIIYKPVLKDYDYSYFGDVEYYSGNNYVTHSSSGQCKVFEVPVDITMSLRNEGDYLAKANSAFISIQPDFTFNANYDGFYITTDTDQYNIYTYYQGFRIKINDNRLINSGIIGLPKDCSTSFKFTIHFVYSYDLKFNGQDGSTRNGVDYLPDFQYIKYNSMNVSAPTEFTWTDIDTSYSDIVNTYQEHNLLTSIRDKIQAILDHYNVNVPQSNNVTNESSALETQSDNVHSQESSYYTQTNTALSNTGLSNFSFSPNVIGGLGKAKDQFTYIWNKIGDYRDVYLFSMIFGISLMIIRHVRPIRRRKEE